MLPDTLGILTALGLGGEGAPPLAQPTNGLVLALGALDTTLALVEFPILIADRQGAVLHANALGYRLLERESTAVKEAVVQMATSGSVGSPWEVVPLPKRGECLGYMAMLRAPASKPARSALSEATRRWNLTARQREVLNLVALGLTNADVGTSLGIEKCTVEFHLSAIFDKAGVDNRTTLIGRLLDF